MESGGKVSRQARGLARGMLRDEKRGGKMGKKKKEGDIKGG